MRVRGNAMRPGELSRFEALLEEALPVVSRVARGLAGRAHAEDLLAESVASALVGFRSLRDESRFTPWLLTIIRNCYRMMLRRRKLRQIVPLEAITNHTQGGTNPGDEAWLDGVLAMLRPVEREAVVLHYLEGFTVAEAARIARTSPGALNMRLARARMRLSELLVRRTNDAKE